MVDRLQSMKTLDFDSIGNKSDDYITVMGLGQKFLIRVGSGQFFVALVGSGQPFMVWVWIWKFSPKNVKFLNFFPFGSKKSLWAEKYLGMKAGQPLIYCGSKVSSGQVRAHLYYIRTNLKRNFFTYWHWSFILIDLSSLTVDLFFLVLFHWPLPSFFLFL